MTGCFQISKATKFCPDVVLEESQASMDDPKRVVIVMDALKEFQMDLLDWVLKKFTFRNCCSIFITGIMPWLNTPLSAKTWSDIWSLDLADLTIFQEKNESKNVDPKYQKVQQLVDLCQKYGVEPEIRTEIGYPLRLRVVDQISSLRATLVVFDRHHDRKYIEYYAKKIPCNMLVVNDNGDVGLIKKRKCEDEISEEEEVDNIVPNSTTTCSKTISMAKLKKCLKLRSEGKIRK